MFENHSKKIVITGIKEIIWFILKMLFEITFEGKHLGTSGHQ